MSVCPVTVILAAVLMFASVAVPGRVEAKPPPPPAFLDTATGSGDNLVLDDSEVFDSPPPARSKSDCDAGGFARFGFRNQGQCIRYVNPV